MAEMRHREPYCDGGGGAPGAGSEGQTANAEKCTQRPGPSRALAGHLLVGPGAAAAAVGFIDALQHLWIEDGRRNAIRAAGPFAQVDNAATVATERHVGIVPQDQRVTGGTAQGRGWVLFVFRHGLPSTCNNCCHRLRDEPAPLTYCSVTTAQMRKIE